MMISTLILYLVLVLQTIYLPLIMHEYEQPCVTSGTALEKAVAYLGDCEFNDEVGLIRESPDQTKDGSDDYYWRYWLTTDNRVAQYALEAAGSGELASTLADTLQTYGDQKHGIIEVLNGEDIDLPPHTEVQSRIVAIEDEDAQVWYEQRTGHLLMNDWETYADLLLYGSLDAFYSGDECTAIIRYNLAMGLFDGQGFRDRYFCEQHLHTTYKLALAIYTAHIIGQPEPQDVLLALLAQQDDISGGFYTLYEDNGESKGSTSTEPTAHAILALSTRNQSSQSNRALTTPAQCTNSNLLPDHRRETAR